MVEVRAAGYGRSRSSVIPGLRAKKPAMAVADMARDAVATKADAAFEDGFLTLTVPEAEGARPEQIGVKAAPPIEVAETWPRRDGRLAAGESLSHRAPPEEASLARMTEAAEAPSCWVQDPTRRNPG